MVPVSFCDGGERPPEHINPGIASLAMTLAFLGIQSDRSLVASRRFPRVRSYLRRQADRGHRRAFAAPFSTALATAPLDINGNPDYQPASYADRKIPGGETDASSDGKADRQILRQKLYLHLADHFSLQAAFPELLLAQRLSISHCSDRTQGRAASQA